MSGGEILSRSWVLKIRDDDDVLQTLGRVTSKDISVAASTFVVADEVHQTFDLELDDGGRNIPINVSGNIHTTGNAAWSVLKQAALASQGHDAIVNIELSSDDLTLSGDVIVKSLNINTGFSDFLKFSASFAWQSDPVIDDKVPPPPAGAYTCPVTTYTAAAPTNQGTLIDPIYTASDAVGKVASVAASADGTWIALGANGHNAGAGTSSGAIFIWTRSGAVVTFSQRLIYSAAATSDLFGNAVDMNAAGTRLASVTLRTGAQRLIIFERTGSTWSETQVITPSSQNTGFGFQVSMDGEGDIIFVSASSGSSPNKIWIFVRDTITGIWSELKTLSPNPLATGTSGIRGRVSGDGKYLVAGESGNDTGATNSGRGFIYYKDEGGVNNWGLQATVGPAVPSTSLQFGFAVAVTCTGNYAFFSRGISSQGGFTVFARTGSSWAQAADVTLDSPSFSGTEFNGQDLAVSTNGTLILVGANGPGATNQGFVSSWFTSDFITWQHAASWQFPGIANSDFFGRAIKLTENGGYCFIGASGRDDEGSGSGAAYSFLVYI